MYIMYIFENVSLLSGLFFVYYSDTLASFWCEVIYIYMMLLLDLNFPFAGQKGCFHSILFDFEFEYKIKQFESQLCFINSWAVFWCIGCSNRLCCRLSDFTEWKQDLNGLLFNWWESFCCLLKLSWVDMLLCFG